MSKLRVNEITNTLDNGPVYLPYGMVGDASNMTLRPGVETFTPNQLATDVPLDSTIQIGFNQNMQFSGVGTIYIREGSNSGSIFEEFECGVAVGATITNNLLTITPTTDFAVDQTYYVSLPAAGIANTLGAYIQPLENYQFNTVLSNFTAQGGDYEFVIADGSAPTGFYKYHIFTNPGILTTTQPSAVALDMDVMMIGGGGAGGSGVFWPTQAPSLPNYYRYSTGGGGAGGLLQMTGPTLNAATGEYSIVVGSGGTACQSIPSPTSPFPYSQRKGSDTRFFNPTISITAFGGGYGGNWYDNNPGTPNEIVEDLGFPSPSDWDYGCPGGSGGGGGGYNPSPPTWSPGGTGVPGQGNAGNKMWNTRYPPGGSPSSIPGSSEIMLGGGGGGAGSSGGQGQGYSLDGPRPNYYGRSGGGGQGLSNPAFPNTVLAPRVNTGDSTTFNRMGPTGTYYAGGGAGGGASPSSPQPPAAGNIGGYGGGGTSNRPWVGQGGPTMPNILEPTEPVDGAAMLGGGGGGGGAHTSPPNPTVLNERRAGNGGPGSVMIRYVHFS